VEMTVTYTLTRDNRLRIAFDATTDKKTVINIINHSYFNLAGSGLVDGETLQIHAHAYTPIDEHSIPTGEIRPVKGTAFDFTAPQLLGPKLNSTDPEIAAKKGLDHNFVIDGKPGRLRRALRLSDPSGRTLEVFTTQPGVQLRVLYLSAFSQEPLLLAPQQNDQEHRDGEPAGGNQHQTIVTDPGGQKINSGAEDVARRAARGNETEQSLGLIAREQVRHEAPEHRQNEQVERAHPDKERGGKPALLELPPAEQEEEHQNGDANDTVHPRQEGRELDARGDAGIERRDRERQQERREK